MPSLGANKIIRVELVKLATRVAAADKIEIKQPN